MRLKQHVNRSYVTNLKMSSKLYYIETDSFDPYHNIALEEYLLDTLPVNSMALYLWQNEKTVVIGKNQSSYNEVNIEKLEADGGHLARRLSGGGAVYHDKGNLNFTFITSEKEFDLVRQNKVILGALKRCGINAEVNGRNDLTVEGRKFSGHAYYHTNKNSYHHGTLMVDVNQNSLADYLNVNRKKLESKRVESVRSRVVNLKQLNPELTVDKLKRELINSYSDVYDSDIMVIEESELNPEEIRRRAERFASAEWKYDKNEHYDHCLEKRFSWGMVRVEYSLKDEVINKIVIHTDSLNADSLISLPGKLKGRRIENGLTELSDNEEEKDVIDLLTGGNADEI